MLCLRLEVNFTKLIAIRFGLYIAYDDGLFSFIIEYHLMNVLTRKCGGQKEIYRIIQDKYFSMDDTSSIVLGTTRFLDFYSVFISCELKQARIRTKNKNKNKLFT